jgi:hypothetical protein
MPSEFAKTLWSGFRIIRKLEEFNMVMGEVRTGPFKQKHSFVLVT